MQQARQNNKLEVTSQPQNTKQKESEYQANENSKLSECYLQWSLCRHEKQGLKIFISLKTREKSSIWMGDEGWQNMYTFYVELMPRSGLA